MNWNFNLLYKDNDSFESDVNFVNEKTNLVSNFKGKLADLKVMNEYLELQDQLDLKLSKLFTYSHMKYDQNQKNNESLLRYQKIYSLYMNIVKESSFFEPEVIEIGYNKIKEMIEKEPNLAKYQYMFDKIFNGQSHILSSDKEELLANYNGALRNFNDLYDQLAVADNKDREVALSDGSKLMINSSNYTSYLAEVKGQEDRRKIFNSLYQFYDNHKNTFATIYKGIIDTNIARMKSRNYDSVLSLYLSGNKIPNAVFHNLIDVARHENKGVKKYLELRKKYFGLEDIYTFDRFLEMSNYVKKYSFEEAKDLYYKAIDSLGNEEFSSIARYVTEDGRIDVEIKDGKRSGAYSTGTYEEGPFILLNFTNTLDDCFTLAHECGHSGHTTLANRNQPIATANYVIFVAEVASTFNEQLLLDYLLKNSQDRDLKISILQNAIDGLIATFFRQTLFGEYEYLAHQEVLDGKGVTSQSLSKIMIDLYKDYYGYDLSKEPLKQFVWCYIPHLFHTPFYVYQYATSFSASLNIYQRVKNGEAGAFEQYLNLLRSGGSDYPINLLKNVGVDLTTKDPFESVVARLDELVNELEKVLGEK